MKKRLQQPKHLYYWRDEYIFFSLWYPNSIHQLHGVRLASFVTFVFLSHTFLLQNSTRAFVDGVKKADLCCQLKESNCSFKMCRLHFNLVINLTLWWKEILCVRFVALFSVNIRNPYFLKKRGFGHIELAKARWTHPPLLILLAKYVSALKHHQGEHIYLDLSL